MRPGILCIGMSIVMLGATTAQANEGARFVGIGAGISHATSGPASHFLGAAGDSNRARVARTAVLADGPPPVAAPPRRGWGGLDPLGSGSTVGFDRSLLGGWSAREDARRAAPGAAPLPADLQALPQPQGDPVSDRPTPVFSARDIGGVIGLSYKIKPPQPSVDRVEPVLPPVSR